MSRLAEHAGVSDPTIVRLVKKLGFSGYADFQEALLSDMDHRLRSPSAQLQPRSHLQKGDVWSQYLADSHRALVETHALTQPEDVRILLEWLLDTRHQVHCFNTCLTICACCDPAVSPWKTTRNCRTDCSTCSARTWS
jgi:DNA-binding MurR/RpiR family transcriptional regulator